MNPNTVNPQNVLKIVNSLGYKNISAKELKEFTKGKHRKQMHLKAPINHFHSKIDLKKLMKYESNEKTSTENILDKHAPENIINVTIINDSKPKENTKPIGTQTNVRKSESQTASATGSTRSRRRNSKKLLLLPKHVKTKNTNIVYKKGTATNSRDGVLVRNTPTDLYQKYQNDWNKFKSFIPGENPRHDVRENIRSMMQHKEEEPPKVIYGIFIEI